MSKGILWLTIPDQSSPVKPRYNQAQHLHVTLKFNVTLESVKKYLDAEVRVKLVEDCWNDEIQAIKVELPGKYNTLCNNKHPHITISHKRGIKPFKSNEMLDETYQSEKINKFLKLRVEFYPFDIKDDEK
jgi:hypothetical protein